MEKKRVIAGAHGPVATQENPQRFIGAEPVEIEVTSYYARRLAEGELIEALADDVKAKKGGK